MISSLGSLPSFRARTGAVALLAATLLASLLLAGTASLGLANHVTPDVVENNPVCTDLNADWYELNISEWGQGTTFTDPFTGFSVTLTNLEIPEESESNQPTKLDWASNYGVSALIVRGGMSGDNVYRYDLHLTPPWATSDVGITPDDEGSEISQLYFCYALTPDILIDKSHDAEGSVTPGTEVTYTYAVQNSGNMPLTNVAVTDLIFESKGEVACEPLVRGDDDPGNDDDVLDVGETWWFTCSVTLDETTENEVCVTADHALAVEIDVVSVQGVEHGTVEDCDTAIVVVAVATPTPTPTSTPSGGQLGGNPTPTPRSGTAGSTVPNTAMSGPNVGIAAMLFGFVLVASLGTLATVNMRANRRRR